MSILNKKLEYGDYQTPIEFCEKIINIIKNYTNPNIVFEPTFGLGNFLKISINEFNKTKYFFGNEINNNYYNTFKNEIQISKLQLFNENIFTFNHNKIKTKIDNKDEILIIGNPPWVTNSQLMTNELKNLPNKSNFKNLKGFDSITGASNFDICEYIIIDLLSNYSSYNAKIAMLCKTSVVVNIMKSIKKLDFKLKNIKMYKFDAKKIFNVSCEACLFYAEIDEFGENYVNVFDINNPTQLLYQFGWRDNKFLSKFNNKSFNIDGEFFTPWRQGIKHDCSKIMEIKEIDNNFFKNQINESFNIEEKYVYQLLKSSDLKENIITSSEKYVIVTQQAIKQDTNHIKIDAPLTWNYLLNHKNYFDKRKSTIYKNSPLFSIFGVGEYSFYRYKVAISGFYKNPNFVFIDMKTKAMMLDDTCYFIGFENRKYAYITMVLLNSNEVKEFLYSIAFLDKKRPYTKDILMRIDLGKLINNIDYTRFCEISSKYKDYIKIDLENYEKFKRLITNNEQLSII